MDLSNQHGRISVQPLGAMLHDCVFRLDDGRDVRPLYDAPWRDDSGPAFDALPPILQGLGSEWPCVPFGRPPEDLPLPPEWMPNGAEPWDDWAHGYSSNGHWQLQQLDQHRLIATIDYPDSTPIRRLERQVRLLDDRPGIALSLTIHARQQTTFPLGLHPVLSMEGAAPESMLLQVTNDARAWSFPIDVEPGKSHFSPNQQAKPFTQLATCGGGIGDLRALPPEGDTEDLLLLTNTDGSVSLRNPVQDCVTTVMWDAGQLPGCMLWISNGGRAHYPWNARGAALGIEPVASTFDLGMAYSQSQNTPLACQGHRTTVTAAPNAPFMCDYQILVSPTYGSVADRGGTLR